MRLAVASVVVLGSLSLLPIFDSKLRTAAPEMHHATDQENHHQTVQGGALLGDHSEDPDIAYSLFMHHSSGIALVAIGLLILLDRLSLLPSKLTLVLIGCSWFAFGAFVFIKSDPEGWPIGPAGFLQSFSMPTAGEWIQHKLLSLIPMLLGVYSVSIRRVPPSTNVAYWAAGAALLGGIGLMIHRHLGHPDFDLVNLQHRIFALTAFFIAGGLLLERRRAVAWRSKPFFVPLGIMILGLQLTLYVE